MTYTCPYGRRRRHSFVAGLVAAFVLTAPALAAGDAQFTPTVDTDKGRVTGLREGRVAEFRGIPYAAAPTGALRFRPPQPRAAWSQPLDATQFGSACSQSARLGTASVDEDCLSLNVYAPLFAQGRRPGDHAAHRGADGGRDGVVDSADAARHPGTVFLGQGVAIASRADGVGCSESASRTTRSRMNGYLPREPRSATRQITAPHLSVAPAFPRRPHAGR